MLLKEYRICMPLTVEEVSVFFCFVLFVCVICYHRAVVERRLTAEPGRGSLVPGHVAAAHTERRRNASGAIGMNASTCPSR